MTRKYMERVVDVTANVAPGADLSVAAAAVERVLRENPPPDGFTVRVGGRIEAQRQAFSGLGLAALLALALVYMVLASQFRSLVDPLVIMFSVPLGISGVLLALYGNRLDAVRAAQEVAAIRMTLASQRAALARAQESLGVLAGDDTGLDAVDDIDPADRRAAAVQEVFTSPVPTCPRPSPAPTPPLAVNDLHGSASQNH